MILVVMQPNTYFLIILIILLFSFQCLIIPFTFTASGVCLMTLVPQG